MERYFYEIEGQGSVEETLQDIKHQLKAKGITIFAQYDHAQNAMDVGMELLPTTVLVFGSPAQGTKLMQVDRRIACALPLRMLVWQAEDGRTHIGFEQVEQMAQAYDLHAPAIVSKLQQLMETLADHAARITPTLAENTPIYFLISGYVMEGKAVHIQPTEHGFTFEIEGFAGCGGPHVITSDQLHHTIFLSREEAEQYKDIEGVYLAGSCG